MTKVKPLWDANRVFVMRCPRQLSNVINVISGPVQLVVWSAKYASQRRYANFVLAGENSYSIILLNRH